MINLTLFVIPPDGTVWIAHCCNRIITCGAADCRSLIIKRVVCSNYLESFFLFAWIRWDSLFIPFVFVFCNEWYVERFFNSKSAAKVFCFKAFPIPFVPGLNFFVRKDRKVTDYRHKIFFVDFKTAVFVTPEVAFKGFAPFVGTWWKSCAWWLFAGHKGSLNVTPSVFVHFGKAFCDAA